MQWLRENTPKDAVIASWWDYGYWIGTLGERKTLADNATVLDWQIRKIAATYMSTPEDAWQILMSGANTDVGSYFVTLPAEIMDQSQDPDVEGSHVPQALAPLALKVKKLDVFEEWKMEDANRNGIVNKDEGNDWMVGELAYNKWKAGCNEAVSYTHLTLPTILLV